MEAGWLKIHTADEEYQGQIIKGLLENHGLHPVLMDKKDDEFRIGVVEIYIAPEEAEQAKTIMAENKKG